VAVWHECAQAQVDGSRCAGAFTALILMGLLSSCQLSLASRKS
jgi:hypothetical protein